MHSGIPRERLARQDTAGVLQGGVHSQRLGRAFRFWRRKQREPLPQRAQLWLWTVSILDMVAVAWLMAADDDCFDQDSTLMLAITLGGHPRLILILAVAGFALLAGLAPPTSGFNRATQLEFALLILACVISVVALAGALSVILLFALACALVVLLLVALIALLIALSSRR